MNLGLNDDPPIWDLQPPLPQEKKLNHGGERRRKKNEEKERVKEREMVKKKLSHKGYDLLFRECRVFTGKMILPKSFLNSLHRVCTSWRDYIIFKPLFFINFEIREKKKERNEKKNYFFILVKENGRKKTRLR